MAVQYFQECHDLLDGDPEGQGEAQMKLSLTCVPTFFFFLITLKPRVE